MLHVADREGQRSHLITEIASATASPQPHGNWRQDWRIVLNYTTFMETKICSVWFTLVFLSLLLDILREVPFGIPWNVQASGFLKYTSYARNILMIQTFHQFGWPRVWTTQRLRNSWLTFTYGFQPSLRVRLLYSMMFLGKSHVATR